MNFRPPGIKPVKLNRPYATIEQYRAMLNETKDPWTAGYIIARLQELEAEPAEPASDKRIIDDVGAQVARTFLGRRP